MDDDTTTLNDNRSVAQMAALRDEIAEQVKIFRRKGGKIKVCKQGESPASHAELDATYRALHRIKAKDADRHRWNSEKRSSFRLPPK